MKIDPFDVMNWILLALLGSMALGVFVFILWATMQAFNSKDYYKDCVMKAVDEHNSSADILAICKELK